MEMFGFFLFLVMVLYLIDKNQGWVKFWKGAKAFVIVVFIAVVVMGGYSYWSERRAAARRAMAPATPSYDVDPYAQIARPMNDQSPAPDFIPADLAKYKTSAPCTPQKAKEEKAEK